MEGKILIGLIMGIMLITLVHASSTILILQDANSENLDDTILAAFDTNPHGADADISLRYSSTLFHGTMMIKFNISEIPIGATINNATLVLNATAESFDPGEAFNISVHYVFPFPGYSISGSEWNEETITRVNHNLTGNFDLTPMDYFYVEDSVLGYHRINVTQAFIDNGFSEDSISLWFNKSKQINTAGTETYRFHSKESSIVNSRPYLIINYTADSTHPYFTTIPANESIAYGNYWDGVTFTATDETALDSYTVNDSRFTINSSGFLNMTNLNLVGVYNLNITINDTSNNLNSTTYALTIKLSGSLNGLFNLNENSGTISHDTSSNGNDGTISGATWQTDGINITLTENTDYTLIGNSFTIINQNHAWKTVTLSWDYVSYIIEAADYSLATKTMEGLGEFGNWFDIIVIVGIAGVILTIVIISFGNWREEEFSY